ncbi:uncharacterized protein G2W53_014258 [Senna tora]|uniref:Uncharacterized protein n=1 Tax=Senna tora TaxID=362788 RepID=A0A834WT61_9FABA|nr:uncharacterized protein G2W53_014258 [Senna tora]
MPIGDLECDKHTSPSSPLCLTENQLGDEEYTNNTEDKEEDERDDDEGETKVEA